VEAVTRSCLFLARVAARLLQRLWQRLLYFKEFRIRGGADYTTPRC
jgi:hypothetical protein